MKAHEMKPTPQEGRLGSLARGRRVAGRDGLARRPLFAQALRSATVFAALCLFLGGAAADAAGDATVWEAQVLSDVPPGLSGVIDGSLDATVAIGTDGILRANAFRLSPDSSWVANDQLSPVPSGATGLSSAKLDPAIWLATQYFNLSRRLDDLPQERDAYQLAVWSFTADLDLSAFPTTNVTVRAAELHERAVGKAPPSRRAPVATPVLNLHAVQTYSSGTRFEARLHGTGVYENGVGGALLRLVRDVDGRPIRIVQTGNTGSAVLDVPDHPDLVGDLHAEWLSRVGPGTVMARGSQHLLLFEPLPLTVGSVSVNNPDVSYKDMPSIAFERLMDKLGASQPLIPMLVGMLVLLGVPAILAGAVENHKRGAFLGTLTLLVTVALIASALLVRYGATDFSPQWANKAKVTDGAMPSVTGEYASSELKGSVQSAFSASCLTDDSVASSWLSGRNLGPGEIAAFALDGPAILRELRIVPGWFDSRENYNKTAKPQLLDVFSETGQVQRLEVVETDYESGPKSYSMPLPEPISGTTFFVQVIGIEGDVRSYAAIAELGLFGSKALLAPGVQPSVHLNSIKPALKAAAECASTNWAMTDF